MEVSLRALWKLHLVDEAISALTSQIVHIDAGQAEVAEFQKCAPEFKSAKGKLEHLRTQVNEGEDSLALLQRKLKDDEASLYSGGVRNQREAQALEHEIEVLKSKIDEVETTLLELIERLEQAKSEHERLKKHLVEIKARAEAKQLRASEKVQALESERKELKEKRDGARLEVEPWQLREYDLVLNRTKTTAMAEVTPGGTCSACKTKLPLKSIDSARHNRLIKCETCHRILYWHPVSSSLLA